MITLEQLQEMFALQEQLEIRIGGVDWRNAGHDYALCIHMECAEIINCYPWKHWKDIDAEVNLDKVAMELVDVWHFAMAHMLMHPKFSVETIYEQLQEAVNSKADELDMTDYCLGLSYTLFTQGQFLLGNFVGMLNRARVSFDELYILYISKNVLNWFRQDNGYREGHYLKNWAGREDNEHLQELCGQLGKDMNAKALYDALKLRYSLVTK